MATPLAPISASRRRRQPHRRQGERSPKRSITIPSELDGLIAAEAATEERTYAAVVAERLRDSYTRNPEPITD